MQKWRRFFLFVMLLSVCSNLYALDLSPLATPRAVAIVAAVYGSTAAISNFLWAFRWNVHAGVSDETSARIQEVGGITAAIECLVLGFIIPLMAYVYVVNNANINRESCVTAL